MKAKCLGRSSFTQQGGLTLLSCGLLRSDHESYSNTPPFKMRLTGMPSYWTGRFIGYWSADLFVAAIVMVVIGAIGVWLGTLASILALAGITAVAFSGKRGTTPTADRWVQY